MQIHHSYIARLIVVYVLILNALYAPQTLANTCESQLKPIIQFKHSLQEKYSIGEVTKAPNVKSQCVVKKSSKGKVSFYGKNDGFAGKLTASGKVFNPQALTAAHKTLPFGTRVRLTNTKNGKTVIVTITDRGPYIHGRELDVSYKAAQNLKFDKDGVANLKIDICNGLSKI